MSVSIDREIKANKRIYFLSYLSSNAADLFLKNGFVEDESDPWS